MTAPSSGAGGLDANARGIIVLVAAVVIGFLLLLNAGASGGGGEGLATDGGPDTTVDVSGLEGDGTTGTTSPGDTTPELPPDDTTDGNRPPAEVTVVVLNGGGVGGAAGAGTETLGGAGYDMADAGNANDSPNVEATTIYYAEGFESDAVSVASVLGRGADAVAARPAEPLGPGAEEADVVVVLGQDAAPVGE